VSPEATHIRSDDRRFVIQYVVLSLAICIPSFWAFLRIRNTYPLASWNMMMSGGDVQSGRTYFILRGETVSGEVIEVSAARLTNALYGRNWGMVAAVVNNEPFKLTSIHPANSLLLERVGGLTNLPAGARVPDLLEVWGRLYNERLAPSSAYRLRALQLDMYRWESGTYSNYDKFIDSWRKGL
jgi:hypothetical protein